MNAFKRYVKQKGYKLENDYPWLPYDGGGYMTIEGVYCSSEYAYITIYYSSISSTIKFNRDGSVSYAWD